MATTNSQPANGAEPPRKKGFSLNTFSSLSNRNIRFLCLGTLFTSAGNWIQVVSLGYLAYELTENPVVVGTVLGSRSIPWLVIGPFTGVMIDRMDRRTILLISQVVRITIALVFGFVLVQGWVEVWHLYLYIILNGIGWVLDNPTRLAVAANSVPRESYQNAIALIQGSFSINRILFPIIGGIIIDVAGSAAINFFIQAACYSTVFVMFYQIKLERREFASKARKSVFGDFVAGVKYVSREPTTLGLIIMGLVPSFFLRPFEDNMLPVFAKEILGQEATGLGMLMSSANIGALFGTFLMATYSGVRRKGLLLIAMAVVSGLGLIALSQMELMAPAIFFLLIVGSAGSMYHLLNTTIIMTITPDNFRGRVTSLFMLDQTGAPLGGLLAGGLAAWFAVDTSMLMGGVVTVVLIVLIGSSFKAIRTAGQEPFPAPVERVTHS